MRRGMIGKDRGESSEELWFWYRYERRAIQDPEEAEWLELVRTIALLALAVLTAVGLLYAVRAG